MKLHSFMEQILMWCPDCTISLWTRLFEIPFKLSFLSITVKAPVSYTHLDVYKRQPLINVSIIHPLPISKLKSPTHLPLKKISQQYSVAHDPVRAHTYSGGLSLSKIHWQNLQALIVSLDLCPNNFNWRCSRKRIRCSTL